MPLSCSSEFSDLCCGENTILLSSDLKDYSEFEESIIGVIDEEGRLEPRFDYSERFRSRSLDLSAREESITWILKVHAFYHFQPLTAYLSVNYLDRFLSSCHLPEVNGWPLQLLSVACLSLAAKMEEKIVPSVVDLQVGDPRYIFEPTTVCRMELLVLSALDWRLRSITPFNFIHFLACKVDASRNFVRYLVSRATQMILATLHHIQFLDHWPSTIAISSILLATQEVPDLSSTDSTNFVSLGAHLNKERVSSCYQLMQEALVNTGSGKFPQSLADDCVTSPTTFSKVHPFVTSSVQKRRKLNHNSWVNDHNDVIETTEVNKEKESNKR